MPELEFQAVVSDFWLNRDVTEDMAQTMWDSWQMPHRAGAIIALGLLLQDIKTVHELGCGSGPNLRRIRDKFPHLTISGSEPHKVLRDFAVRQGLEVTDITLPSVPDKPVDVVLSMYTLAYVEDVAKVLANLLRTRYLVLIEPTAGLRPFSVPGGYASEREDGTFSCGIWAHDYEKIARSTGWTLKWRWPILPEDQGLNVVAVYER